MDPNAVLRTIRESLAALDTARMAIDGGEGPVMYWDRVHDAAVVSLAEAVEALDEWLTRGGFFPSAWHADSRVSA